MKLWKQLTIFTVTIESKEDLRQKEDRIKEITQYLACSFVYIYIFFSVLVKLARLHRYIPREVTSYPLMVHIFT